MQFSKTGFTNQLYLWESNFTSLAAEGPTCLRTTLILRNACEFYDYETQRQWKALHQEHRWPTSEALTFGRSKQLFVHRSIISVTASHRFHFCRYNIFTWSFFFYPSFFACWFFLFVCLVGWLVLFFFLKKEMLKTKTLETTYTRISLLLLHHTTSIIMAHVNMTGTKIRVMRISFGGSSQWTLSKVQFEKNCLWIPVIKLSARGFGQKQLALLASRSVHWVKLL